LGKRAGIRPSMISANANAMNNVSIIFFSLSDVSWCSVSLYENK